MALSVENENTIWSTTKQIYPLTTALLALAVAVVTYLTALLGTFLSRGGVAALWPANALLVSMLLLMPRRTWGALIPACLAGFLLHDLQVGLAPSSIALFALANTIEILIIALGLGYSFDGIPRLNSSKALAKYLLVAVLLGPFVSSFVGAFAIPGFYWTHWRVFFFSDALAFLTLTPAFLSWLGRRPLSKRSPVGSQLEAGALIAALACMGYLIFFAHWRTVPPALLYSLVPILLWAALRFGFTGVSTSMIVIAFFSIWGCIHARGPFTGPDPFRDILSLQLFLLFAATPFMWLAVMVEEREQDRLIQKELGGRLISAQEEERRRIARELHDDISQKLALLSMELGRAPVSGSPEATKEHLEEIKRHCSQIAYDVQSLSHKLHSSKLDYLGMVPAIRSFCNDFAQQYDVSIEFKDRNVPTHLPKDISLCLFRVVQEALHNAVKHSGVSQFTVEVSATANEVQLMVRDPGTGFDLEEAKRSQGLGLMSLQERIHLVHGRFHLESRPGAGTTIVAAVPMIAKPARLQQR